MTIDEDTDHAHSMPYDALLVVSFGGPEGLDEVMPFLENVLRGRHVPRERMLEVAHHYELFGGVSPINAQNRALVAALRDELERNGPPLPIYWGNRNWPPMLADTMREMAGDGIRHALAFVTSAYSSYSGCRQYREDLARARAEVGPDAPQVSILRRFYNHPAFIEVNREHVRAALDSIPAERRARAPIAFTAHSIPESMARASWYERQLAEACRMVAERVEQPNWRLVYQSRSGPPTQPWLEPDIIDHLRALHAAGVEDVVIAPIGFISDHLEVLYDLDVEARQLAETLGLNVVRAATAGVHPAFIAMIRELVLERMTGGEKRALGTQGPCHDICPVDCCLPFYGRPATVPAV
jgi:protoporphyrin/coproporphyrin ferrochelatase